MSNEPTDQATCSVQRRESALRLRTALVAQQLINVTAAASEIPGGFWPILGFASIQDMTSYVACEIGRANATYMYQRRGRLDDNQALRIVVAAEAAISAIGREPAIVAFLAKGASVEVIPFKFACRMLMALLDVTAPAVAPRTSASSRTGCPSGSGSGNSARSAE